MFAPQVCLASTDPWFPVSVEWFVEHSSLYFKGASSMLGQQDAILVEEFPSLPSISSYTSPDINMPDHSSYGTSYKDRSMYWYLKLRSQKYYEGMKEEISKGLVPVYAHVLYKESMVEIQYYYFYSYNGNIVEKVPEGGAHEGDWEHTSVRLSSNIIDIVNQIVENNYNIPIDELKKQIISIFYARHGKEGKWYFQEKQLGSIIDDGYQLVKDSLHHIVYSAKGGHASYTTANHKQRRYVPLGIPLGLIDDYTDELGKIWKTWENVFILRPNEQESNWMHFNGRWGGMKKSYLGANGPFGPLMKTYYFSGDEEPSDCNSVYNERIPNPCAPHINAWISLLLRCFISFTIILILATVLYIYLIQFNK